MANFNNNLTYSEKRCTTYVSGMYVNKMSLKNRDPPEIMALSFLCFDIRYWNS